MRVDLSEQERVFLERLLSKAMDRLGNRLEDVDPDSQASHRIGTQLAFMNALVAKLYPPVAATEAERRAAAAAGPDGVLSGDIRRLIDYLHLETGED